MALSWLNCRPVPRRVTTAHSQAAFFRFQTRNCSCSWETARPLARRDYNKLLAVPIAIVSARIACASA